MRNDYFEGVLQLRNPSEEALRFIDNQITKEEGNVWVAKTEKHKTGIDLYVSSNKFLLNLGKKLKKSFKGGELVVTGRLHSRDRVTSKDKYRMTVLFRM